MAVEELVGKTLGAYKIESVLGRGGGGTVFRGRHAALDKEVAVKVLEGALDPSGGRWLAEARAAAQLRDPRVVQVFDAAAVGSWRYVVMELVEGETLQALLRRAGPLPPERAVPIMREVLRGIAAAHARGLVHRDIKPENIMLTRDGGVKILDFGLAAWIGAGLDDEQAAGSLDYMAPERAFGTAPDAREDLYSFGATFYFALTGQPPFAGTTGEVMLKHRIAPVPEVRERSRMVTPELSSLIKSLLEKDAARRPVDARSVLAALESSAMLFSTGAAAAANSPFVILPPPPEPQPEGVAADPEIQAALRAGPAYTPRAPMPAPPPALPQPPRMTLVDYVLLAAAFAAFSGRHWLSVGTADLAGLGAVSGLFCAALAFQDGDGRVRQAAGTLLLACAAGSWVALFKLSGAVPGFEAMAAAGVGGALAVGGLVMGFFAGRGDRVIGAALLAAAAAAWAYAVPGAPALLKEVFSGEGARRWGGLAAAYAFYAVRRSCG